MNADTIETVIKQLRTQSGWWEGDVNARAVIIELADSLEASLRESLKQAGHCATSGELRHDCATKSPYQAENAKYWEEQWNTQTADRDSWLARCTVLERHKSQLIQDVNNLERGGKELLARNLELHAQLTAAQINLQHADRRIAAIEKIIAS